MLDDARGWGQRADICRGQQLSHGTEPQICTLRRNIYKTNLQDLAKMSSAKASFDSIARDLKEYTYSYVNYARSDYT